MDYTTSCSAREEEIFQTLIQHNQKDWVDQVHMTEFTRQSRVPLNNKLEPTQGQSEKALSQVSRPPQGSKDLFGQLDILKLLTALQQ